MPYDPKTGKHYDYTKEGIEKYEEETGGGMPYTPFKMKGSPFQKNKQTDAEFIAEANRQKQKTINSLIRKAESEGLSGEAAKKAAEKEYKRNI